MANNINTMQIWCYINYHWNNTKIKSIQSNLFQCLFYTNKALNLGHLVKVLWKHLNSTNTRGSPLCDGVIHYKMHIIRSNHGVNMKGFHYLPKCFLFSSYFYFVQIHKFILLCLHPICTFDNLYGCHEVFHPLSIQTMNIQTPTQIQNSISRFSKSNWKWTIAK